MPVRVAFLIVRLFPMYVLALATDALRLANKYAGQRRFDWIVVSDDGEPVESSNGITMECDISADEAQTFNYVFVLAGDDQSRSLTPRLRRWLTRMGRTAACLGCIDSGAFLLAQSRLIRQRSVTVHPGARAALKEQFPQLRLMDDELARDGTLMSSAGGVSVIGLMMALIQDHCGASIVREVAEDMVVPGRQAAQRAPTVAGIIPNFDLGSAVALMESTLEEPLTLDRLSQRLACSRRQITRHFQRTLQRSPMAHYRSLRLNHARQLLLQSDASVSDVATAVGFQSLSAFTRCFTRQFGLAPSRLRSTLRTEGNAAVVPVGNKHKQVKKVANRTESR